VHPDGRAVFTGRLEKDPEKLPETIDVIDP
jgi:hypothetical protein